MTTKAGKTTKRIRWATMHKCRCEMCGGEFQSIRAGARICSNRCRMAKQRGRVPLVQSVGEGGADERGHEGLSGQALATL